MMVTGAGVIGSVVVRVGGDNSAAQMLAVGALMLPGAMALMAYPRLSFRHAIDFCAWVIVAAVGVLATLRALDLATAGTLAAVSCLALIAHNWRVLESGDEPDQEAVLWLLLAVLSTGSVAALLFLEFGAAAGVVCAVLISAVGPAMAIGVRRPGLTDVRSLVVTVVVFGVVALTFVSLYMTALACLELVGADDPSPGVYAFLGVALAAGFHPLSVVLRGIIDELLFGDRPDPLLAATAVADQIGDDPLLALRAIREALLLPYASISSDGVELAASGTAVTEVRRLPLSLGSDTMGEVVVGLRPGELALSVGDEQVLRIVAPLLAQTLRARRLSKELKESRSAAITAIEEERRRLRRDLHDGLAPTLSGIGFTADAARNTITSDPEGADELLRGLRAEAVTAVGEIRRLVYNMRPPALDELGLVPALRQQVASVRTSDGQPMRVEVEAIDLPSLPAAVEVAAFRIAAEAVMNSARHSGTDRAWVLLQREDDCLQVKVRDAGTTGGAWVQGVGLSSMRERAAELGGTLQVSSNGDGSTVNALLPLG